MSKAETPNTVHGRLLEAVHISGYTFERACDELEWLLDGERWKSIGEGFDDINAFLSTIDFSGFRIAIDQRKKLAKRLSEIQASQRSTAKMLGVGHQTIGRDLHDGPNGPKNDGGVAESNKEAGSNGPNGPPASAGDQIDPEAKPGWTQDDVDPAKLAKIRAARKQRDEEAEAKRAEQKPARGLDAPSASIERGDFREVFKELRNVNAIITDPPYGKEHLSLLKDLAEWADAALVENGVLAVMFGQTHLSEAYRLLDGGRPYRWTLAYLTPGPGYVSHARKVQSQWKPVLVYGGGERLNDVLSSSATGGGVEKANHEWEQDFDGFRLLIERLSAPGDLIADPFAGSGTTLLAALACGRNAVGAELDDEHYRRASKRLG